ncbi:hypothetical protein PFISCL1PPCAC_12915, partial [Pristionchus fissidentatus]
VMVFGCDCCSINSFVYLVGAFAIASKVLPFLHKKLVGKKPIELQEKNYKKDVVYLYQFPGTPTCTSFSPFCIKVEAFCRLHNLKFETYPDEQTAAIGHAVDRFIDNHTFRLMLRTRVAVLDKLLAFVAAPKVPAFLLPIIAPLGGYFAGNMLQTILGKKKFLVADEPTAVDCTAFSHFGTFYYALPSARNNLHSLLDSSKFSVLKEYVVRCQERLFGNDNMVFGCDCCCISAFVYLVGVLAIASKVLPFLHKKFMGRKPIEILEKAPKKDVVYLYQFPGTPSCSSMSPFCIKVEAFCRLHDIKVERRNTYTARGANGLLPFIELNGEQHSDSQIIVKRLTQIFKLRAYPDEQTAAIGHAVDRMLDNHTFYLMQKARIPVLGQVVSFMVAPKVPSFLLPIVASLASCLGGCKMSNRVAASIGKFADNENDLTQLQTILGKKKFLLAEEPTAVDCTAMGQLGYFYYAVPSARFYVHDLIDSAEFTTLKEYIER